MSPSPFPTGKTDDAKASEKGNKAPSKSGSAGIQRSPSDAGKSSGDEGGGKKPPSGIARPPGTTGSFGYKKIPAGALITSSGATLHASGSATLGKVSQFGSLPPPASSE